LWLQAKNKTKTINLCGLSRLQASLSRQPVAAASKKKNNQPVSRVVNLRKQGKTIFKRAGKKLFTCPRGDKQKKQNNTQPVQPVATASKTKPRMQDKTTAACQEERTINLSTCESSSWISESRGEQSSSKSKQIFTCARGRKQ